MGPGADAADVADGAGHLFHRAALAKFFKAAQGLDMQFGIGDIARVIQGDSYLGMAFDSRYWLNIDDFTHAPPPYLAGRGGSTVRKPCPPM